MSSARKGSAGTKQAKKAASSSRATIRRTEVDGVTCFWTPVPGPFTAALLFRVGRRDESLPTTGVSHLVEHLALSHLDPHDLNYNGHVELGVTVFHASGAKKDVADFLNSTTTALTELPSDRFEAEKRILTTEASGRSKGIFERMCTFRFGARGPGLIGYDELGLRTIDHRAAQRWADARFSAADAVLLLSGSPPRGLRLNLRDGERSDREVVEELDQPLPSFAVGDDAGVALSFIAPRSAVSAMMAPIVQKRLHDKLRRQMGVTYNAFATSEPLYDDDLLVVIGADIHGDHLTDGWGEIMRLLRELAEKGPSKSELEWVRRKYRESLKPAQSRFAVLDWYARDVLAGRRPRSLDARLKDLAAVPSREVAEMLMAGLEDTLWVVPGSSQIPEDGLHPFSDWSPDRVAGRKYRTKSSLSSQSTPEGTAEAKRRLVVGAEGVTLLSTKRQFVTVRYRECAGVLSWSNGDRMLVGNDGFMLPVTVGQWLRGRRVVNEIDARVDPDLVIPMGDPSLQQPQLPSGPSPAFMTFMRVVGWIVLPFLWLSAMGSFASFFDAGSRARDGLGALAIMFVVSVILAGSLTWGMVRGIRKRRREKAATRATAG